MIAERPRTLTHAAGAALLLALQIPATAACSEPNVNETIRPARDGNIAIAQELEAARKAGTVAAYDLFIARHPDHPLAEIARRERAALIARHPR